ncbi:NAC domain-containing protein 83-like [Vicia villosa]|uniref:NAC domain-containing protein 83-like n=1 Tax=Vicia villosa TaxID=3911 RepID=UPI00273C2C49|nr:NAC domain-containing protein 83-like [Vicia villosa]
MDKLNFIKNGVSRLPPGFRFQPTDEELVFQYLKCKIFSCPLPASIIPEVNVCKYDPWDLPGGCDEHERHFFSSKEAKYRNSNRMSRTTKCGYWKATGSDKRISSSTCNGIVGIRKTLVFYQGKSPNGSRTNWILHEYRLVNVETSPCNSTQNYGNEIGDWLLCRLSTRKRNLEYGSTSTHNNNNNNASPNSRLMFDFMMVNNKTCSSTSSSCSSSSNNNNNIEVSSNLQDHEQDYADHF